MLNWCKRCGVQIEKDVNGRWCRVSKVHWDTYDCGPTESYSEETGEVWYNDHIPEVKSL